MKRALGASILILLVLALPPGARAAFEPGIVKVDGYDWSVSSNPVKVPLDQDGTRTYTVDDILEVADGMTSEFSLANVPGIEILRPATAANPVRCSGNQVRAGNDACPRFVASVDKTTMILKSGARIDYADAAPTIFITQATDLAVTLSPTHKKIKSGTRVKFTASVSGANGSSTYSWDFGDGKTAETSGGSSSSIAHVFTGDDQSFNVVVTVISSTNPRSYEALSVITVGKVKKATKQPKKKEPKHPDDSNEDDSSSYDPGYVPGPSDYYDDGPGTGFPSTGSPAPSSPEPDQKRNQPVTDDNGQTVTGQLIDPIATATVIPTTGEPATGEAEAGPVGDDSGGGGGIPDGAKAALGIGALLGLGGLTEAGAFSGAFRRLRLRP